MNNEARLYEIFRTLGISDFTVQEHEAIVTVEQGEAAGITVDGFDCKNLLIKEKKADKYYMVVIEAHRMMDMTHFKEVTGWKKVRFAHDEELFDLLGLVPGSVTPLALFADTEKKTTVVLGKELAEAEDDAKLLLHPCRNTASMTLKKGDFMKFLAFVGCEIICEE